MKFHFDPDLDYQHEAITAITHLFQGQEICQTNFTVPPLTIPAAGGQKPLSYSEDLGYGNRLRLLDEDILENLRQVQLQNGLSPSKTLDGKNFTVEMETGTGKTYVYLRTIFEMNRLYGFTKYIIVVPSIAIKEGVKKSIEMTEKHFKGLYQNKNYDYFVYDSQNLGQVRNFATSDYLQIMVINIDAFRKSFTDPEKADKANIIHRAHDFMDGNKPIEFIQATNPIVIIDEPQSVDTTAKSKEAIASLNPMCTLRYSATHVEKYNMVYKLDSVDAYEKKLVKQIEVAGIDVQDSHNQAYIKLLSVKNAPRQAQIELDVQQRGGKVKRQKKKIIQNDDLLDISGGRSVYDGYIIRDIYCEAGNEYIDFTSKPDNIRIGQSIGDVDDDQYKRLQIRKTIDEHLDKELKLRPRGLKVLSLFFIDRVSNYRSYDDDGNPQPGKYAQMFEDEYGQAIRKPKYHTLFKDVDLETAAVGVHDGYFAIDKKKVKDKTVEMYKESRGAGTTQADESAYNTIMKDKEWLLSLDCKLKFIFSHSALREGWDNPNVFQICTLNETASTLKKRQEIGRGLRIAVNQDGERVYGFDVNTLTVMANESYEDFARQLQKEIEEEEGIKFGVVEEHIFANISYLNHDNQLENLGIEKSKEIWRHLNEQGFINDKGKVQDALREALKAGDVQLPEAAQDCPDQVIALLRKVAGKLNLNNRDDREKVKLNKAVYLSDDFKQLWDRIKYKTTFRVDFDSEELIKKCAKRIEDELVVGKARFVYSKSQATINRGGVQMSDPTQSIHLYEASDYYAPDIVSYLQNETNLTRRTLVEILIKSKRLDDFKNNPQKFIELVLEIIKHEMQLCIVDGIKYEKIGGDFYYAQELFQDQELFGYLSSNMLEAKKAVYDHVVYDSDVERDFAQDFELSDDIKVYAKLPGWFKIDTPLGSYNPDWAVLVEVDQQPKLYFVVETKGKLLTHGLSPDEKAKIDCGRAHFKAIGSDVKFTLTNSFGSFSDQFIS